MSNPFLKQVFNKDKTFRPKRKFEPGTQRFELHKKAQASLNAGLDLRLAVQLPPGEDLHDWVAVHVVDFFNRVNLIYGTISDGCTEQSCPIMSGGPKYEYRWQDEHKFRKPTALSAPRYMDLLMDWIEVQINDEGVFPTNVGTPFPKNFLQTVRKILSRLFRVFVHVYIHHFDRIAQLGSEAHVNTCYKHFYYFVREFGLIDTKELEPLDGFKQKTDSHRGWRDVDKVQPSLSAGGNVNGAIAMENGPTVLQKIKHRITMHSSTSTSRYMLRRRDGSDSSDVCTRMCTAASPLMAKRWKQPGSTHGGMGAPGLAPLHPGVSPLSHGPLWGGNEGQRGCALETVRRRAAAVGTRRRRRGDLTPGETYSPGARDERPPPPPGHISLSSACGIPESWPGRPVSLESKFLLKLSSRTEEGSFTALSPQSSSGPCQQRGKRLRISLGEVAAAWAGVDQLGQEEDDGGRSPSTRRERLGPEACWGS
ncbi:PREDICTED: MOB kinase activator 3A [Galeopterus variegatus]|uniref:MOB kinase activator 3A n=4 Tax=Euarchontoglires TaxID=314146 RepID=A0ABM0S3M1_GALVR|nr:PREDICTED: MOB kinase activator 3A [Galeopterus variegatus]